ncbi:hypothetical protein [Shinella zoogloeoides]|jgi:hypothetical protein|uniref:hypothetical protein n=1 Tax=Shinella zoogloeoides TaxID=352475 RepID=UPI0028AF548E|nr:hypothetical protein [Shinella zoogloeoides]
MTATKEEFFKPAKLSAQDKAARTDDTARGIIAQETNAREAKTARLRAMRLDQQAKEPAPAPRKGRKTAAGKIQGAARANGLPS